MGEAEINNATQQIIIHSVLFVYGGVNDALSFQIAKNSADHWNEANGTTVLKNRMYDVIFDIEVHWSENLTPEMVFENINPRNNYFRIESFAGTDISFVDGIGSNTGYFKLDNLLNNPTTAAHADGHTIGLHAPDVLAIRGRGRPGLMSPRHGTVGAG